MHGSVKVKYVKVTKTTSPVKAQTRKRGKVKRFRRLTLSDTGPELGEIMGWLKTSR